MTDKIGLDGTLLMYVTYFEFSIELLDSVHIHDPN